VGEHVIENRNLRKFFSLVLLLKHNRPITEHIHLYHSPYRGGSIDDTPLNLCLAHVQLGLTKFQPAK